MCCPVSPKDNLAVRVVVLIFSVINFALLVTALAVPYVSVTGRYGTRVSYGLFVAKGDEVTARREIQNDYDAACAAFEIIAVILSFVSAVLMVLLTVIQSKWNNGEEMWLDHERGMAIAVLTFSVVIFVSSVVALGLCGFIVSVIRFDYRPYGSVEPGLIVLVPVMVLSFVNMVLCSAGSCFGITYCGEYGCCGVGGDPRRRRTNPGHTHNRKPIVVDRVTGYPVAIPVRMNDAASDSSDERPAGVYISVGTPGYQRRPNGYNYYRDGYQHRAAKQANYV